MHRGEGRTMTTRSDDLDGRTDGERRRDAALDLLAARRDVYLLRGRRALLAVLLIHGSATVDAVRAAVELPAGIGPKLFGAVPKALVAAGIIAADGFDRTTRRTAHARPVTVWRLLDRSKAESWLSTHPDLSDPSADDLDGARFDGDQGLLFPILSTLNIPSATGATAALGN
jgi:hypothetical protein